MPAHIVGRVRAKPAHDRSHIFRRRSVEVALPHLFVYDASLAPSQEVVVRFGVETGGRPGSEAVDRDARACDLGSQGFGHGNHAAHRRRESRLAEVAHGSVRSGVDHSPPALPRHARHRMTGDEPLLRHLQSNSFVIKLFAHLKDAALQRRPSAVHGDVYLPESLFGVAHHLPGSVESGHIRHANRRRAASRSDLGRSLLGRGGVAPFARFVGAEVVHHDIRPVPPQQQSDSLADPVAAACDESVFAFEFHAFCHKLRLARGYDEHQSVAKHPCAKHPNGRNRKFLITQYTMCNIAMTSPTASREFAFSKRTPSEKPAQNTKDDESGVAAGITVLILAVPLLIISALAFYSGRLAQADNHLSWAATSAARAGANCRTPVAASDTRPCTFREAALTIEKTVRAILLENRRLYCYTSGATGMRAEFQDRDGSLIYSYVIGSLLLSGRYWPDRGGDIPPVGDDENPDGDPNYAPLQPSNLRRDFNGDALFLESSEGVVVRADSSATPPIEEERESNPLVFETSTAAPLGSNTPVSRIAVHLICDFTGASSGLLARASTREGSATAVVPAAIPAETS